MNGPGIRSGRMVLLASGIVDERPRALDEFAQYCRHSCRRGTCERLGGRGPGTLLSFERSGEEPLSAPTGARRTRNASGATRRARTLIPS
jgi:hypothetical protein